MTGGILMGSFCNMNKKDITTQYIIGIDEVGRGPLAGPVTVCACMIPLHSIDEIKNSLLGITDSKKLSEKQREKYWELLQPLIHEKKISFGLSHVSAQIIDTKGIQYAINKALIEALESIHPDPYHCYLYLDGGLSAPLYYRQETIIKGDQSVFCISVASVIAKVSRDKKMLAYAKDYPNYGFDKHKGYGTKAHREAIQKYGTTSLHRISWIKH